jgi:hypothetical protein
MRTWSVCLTIGLVAALIVGCRSTPAPAPAAPDTTAVTPAPTTPAAPTPAVVTLECRTFTLTDAALKDLAGACGGKAVLFDKETAKAATSVNLLKGTYEVTVYLQAPDSDSDAIYVSVNKNEERLYPDEYGSIQPTRTYTVEVQADGPCAVEIVPAETGMLLDRVVLKKIK